VYCCHNCGTSGAPIAPETQVGDAFPAGLRILEACVLAPRGDGRGVELELVAPPAPEELVELDALDDALWLELVAPPLPEVVEPPEPHPAASMAAIGAARGASFRRGRKR